jgi:hypothetical protein
MRFPSKLAGMALALAVTTCLVALSQPALAEKQKKGGGNMTAATQGDSAQNAMMAEMMKYSMPGAPHEKLQKLVGKWKAVAKMWYGPGEPEVTEGDVEYRATLGGRYLEQIYKGSMMGKPFEGHGLTGYDNRKQQYWNFWFDNSSTSGMLTTGTANEAGDEITLSGTADGPDGNPMQYRDVLKLVGADKHVLSMYGMMGDKEALMMEITYTRR